MTRNVCRCVVRYWTMCLAVIVVIGIGGSCAGVAPKVMTAFQIPNEFRYPIQPEGNAAINEAKAKITDPGSMVYIYLHNSGVVPVDIVDIRWDGKGLEEHRGSYELIWHRLHPSPLQAGDIGELALCLRHQLRQSTEVSVAFSDDAVATCVIEPAAPDFRVETIAFGPKLRQAYVYVQQQAGGTKMPAELVVDDGVADCRIKWLNDGGVNGLRVALVEFTEPLRRGSLHTFLVSSTDNEVVVAATIRAYADLAVFGTYGSGDVMRYAINGLTGFTSFVSEPKELFDRAQQLGVRVVTMVHGNPRPECYGHPGIYAYNHYDEPDVKDWRYNAERAECAVGAHAPQMLQCDSSARADASVPTMLTLNLTYTPYNYFIYGPIADITNPDCYPLSVGWSIRQVRDYVATMKLACMPKPFTYAYQGCWEESSDQQAYVDGKEVRAKGWDAFRAETNTRGLRRAPVAGEARIPMFYGVGCGARGLFSFFDSTCANQGLLFHGSEDLPELWAEIGRTSRTFNQVAELIDIAHPIDWVRSDASKLWVSTLVCGEDAALVIVVNEDFDCTAEGFSLRPMRDAALTFNDWPWLKGHDVFRLDDEKMDRLSSQRDGDSLLWRDSITDAQMYLIVSDAAVAQELQKNARAKADRQARAILAELRKAQ